MKLSKLLNELLAYDKYISGIANYLNNASEGDLNTVFSSIVNNSDQVIDGSIFVAIDGSDADGHKYISNAKNSGAVFCVGTKSNEKNNSQPDMIVENSRAFISSAASIFYNNPTQNLNVYGITGTNGKTTTSYILSSILKTQDKKSCVIGTTGIFVNDIKYENIGTTPDSTVLQKLYSNLNNDEIKNVVMEVTSHALAQYRVLGTHFKCVAFTNLTQDHLDFHESFEAYFESKALLFNGEYSKKGVINIDNTYGVKLFEIANKNSIEIITTSTKDKNADLFIKLISSTLTGCEIEIIYKKSGQIVNSRKTTTSLVGDFNCENIATAVAMAICGGIDFDEIVNSLSEDIFVPGRLQRITNKDSKFEVFVDYSHTPDALERAIGVLKPLSNRVIVVFGCGGDRDKSKRPIMGKISSEMADLIVLTNDNPRSENPESIIKEIMSGIAHDDVPRVIAIEDRYKAIEYSIMNAKEKDAVLIAGKGHETYQEFADNIQDFSDVKVVEEILIRYTREQK